MDIVKQLSDTCHEALRRDQVQDLYKNLPKIKQYMGARAFYTQFVPDLMERAAEKQAVHCFRHVIEHNQLFKGKDADGTYKKLFETNQYDLIELFWEKAEPYLSPAEFKKLKTQTSLDHAYTMGSVDLARFAVLHGADVHKRDHDGTSTYLYKAISADNLDLVKFTLGQGVQSKPNYTNLIGLMRKHNAASITPYIETLLEYGHLTPEDSTKDELFRTRKVSTYNNYYAGYTPPKSDIAEKYIERVFNHWKQRGEFKKFPAQFKPAMKTENLSAKYNAAAGFRTTALHGLAMGDRFEEAINIAIRDKTCIKVSDLMEKDGRGHTVIDILGARNTLGLLNNAALWRNNRDEYFNLVRQTKPVYRKQYDVEGMKNAFKMMRVYEKMTRNNGQFKRRKTL